MKYKKLVIAFFPFLLLIFSGSEPSCSERVLLPTGPGSEIIKIDGDTEKITWDANGNLVWDAPVGDRVLFAFPLPEGVRFEDFGLCKFDLKIEGGPVDVMVFLERPSEKRMVYRPVNINKPKPGWQTIHLDLNQPEIIRESHNKTPVSRIAFNLWSMNTGYPGQEPTRNISIRNLRFVKSYIDVQWNGMDYRAVSGVSGDLVYEYPVTVRNPDAKPHSITARIERLDGRYGHGDIIPDKTVLAPGDSAVFKAVLRLPEERLKELPALYCEWFLPVFSVDGIPDSGEGIIRSSDRISLPLIIMPELKTPVVPFDRDGLRLMRERYMNTAWGKKEGDGIIAAGEKILSGGLAIPDGPGWARAYYYCHEHRCVLKYEGPDRHYCPVGGEYRSVDFMGVDLDRDYMAGEHNKVTGWTRTLALAYTLTGEERFSRGARQILIQYREKYFTFDWLDLDASIKTIDKGRLHFAKYMETYGFRAMIEALEILKATGGIPENEARDIEQNLLLPALVEITDYRMDMLGRQTTITTTALIGGLALRHAPLVAFAVKSPFGYFSLRRWGATADGLNHGHGYSRTGYTLHQVEMAELLYRLGIDTFDSELKRLIDGPFWWSVPMEPERMSRIFSIAARHYPDPVYRKYARRSLIDGEPPPFDGSPVIPLVLPSVNFPNSGLSILRRPADEETLNAEFKWSMPDNRGSFSVLSLGLYFYGYGCQSYPGHFHWGSTDLHHNWQIQSASHSTLVVDCRNHSGMKDYFKGHYMPHPSEQLYFEDGKDAAATVAYNDRIYPGVGIWRAVCVLDGAFLIIDALRSESEHTYDRWFHGVPDFSNGREGLSVELKPRLESIGEEDGYDMVQNLSMAETEQNFRSDWIVPARGEHGEFTLSMQVLNSEPLEVIHGFEWSRQYSTPEKEFLLMRRTGTRNADFVVLLEPHHGESKLSQFERFTVNDNRDRAVDSVVGLNITLGEKHYEVILNPCRTNIQTRKGITDNVFSLNCN